MWPDEPGRSPTGCPSPADAGAHLARDVEAITARCLREPRGRGPARVARSGDAAVTREGDMLSEAVRSVVTGLGAAHPSIRAVWLIGSRANATERPDSDWDLIIFGDAAILAAIRADLDLKRRCAAQSIEMMVVYDSDNFVEPWPPAERENKGSLNDWKWRASGRKARYAGRGKRSGFMSACRVWPP